MTGYFFLNYSGKLIEWKSCFAAATQTNSNFILQLIEELAFSFLNCYSFKSHFQSLTTLSTFYNNIGYPIPIFLPILA